MVQWTNCWAYKPGRMVVQIWEKFGRAQVDLICWRQIAPLSTEQLPELNNPLGQNTLPHDWTYWNFTDSPLWAFLHLLLILVTLHIEALKLPTITCFSLLLLLVDRMPLSSCSLNSSVVRNDENDLVPLARLPTPVVLALWSEHKVQYYEPEVQETLWMQETPVQEPVQQSVCSQVETHKLICVTAFLNESTRCHLPHSPKSPTWDFLLVMEFLKTLPMSTCKMPNWSLSKRRLF